MRPFSRFPLDNRAVREMPSTVSMKISGDPNSKTRGRARGMEMVSPIAPSNPPAIDDMNASERALAPFPCLAISWPSSSRTDAAAEPGIPIRMEAIASEWCTTATAPMMRAIAGPVSSTKMKGSRIATAAVPPSPGMTPTTSPAITPIMRKSSIDGSRKDPSAAKAASIKQRPC